METLPLLTFILSVGIIVSLTWLFLIPFTGRLVQLKKLNQHISSSADLKALHTRLELLMLERRPFLNPAYDNHMLAEHLGMDAQVLDYFLHAYLETSFHQLVDAYRVQYACLMLQSEAAQDLPMDAIARASGFVDRQMFFQCFRRRTGKTPVQYLNYLVFAKNNLQVA
ncbi:Helix-turn-helix domain-containing protein [Cnuella takakiae]|uniref:Helix-turn-helix domain-containing protein n=1 Tax=Cnuella takakiae TaxID=1302690 RepID=A0A1M5A1I0_9BACT|nr:helix-turn-helix domain-containing protein [Cnuella takakiae]OLY92129.1 hypothetical protein BUE76_09640 [Cnuella takakiae]SHF24169.1 Helix-turn-helix domain-containing protein [Cnuella takakiae]